MKIKELSFYYRIWKNRHGDNYSVLNCVITYKGREETKKWLYGSPFLDLNHPEDYERFFLNSIMEYTKHYNYSGPNYLHHFCQKYGIKYKYTVEKVKRKKDLLK